MPMAVSSVAHADRVRSLCRKVVKEVSAAARPGGMSVVHNLDRSCDAIDRKDQVLSDGGKPMSFIQLILIIIIVAMALKMFI